MFAHTQQEQTRLIKVYFHLTETKYHHIKQITRVLHEQLNNRNMAFSMEIIIINSVCTSTHPVSIIRRAYKWNASACKNIFWRPRELCEFGMLWVAGILLEYLIEFPSGCQTLLHSQDGRRWGDAPEANQLNFKIVPPPMGVIISFPSRAADGRKQSELRCGNFNELQHLPVNKKYRLPTA